MRAAKATAKNSGCERKRRNITARGAAKGVHKKANNETCLNMCL